MLPVYLYEVLKSFKHINGLPRGKVPTNFN